MVVGFISIFTEVNSAISSALTVGLREIVAWLHRSYLGGARQKAIENQNINFSSILKDQVSE